MNLHYFQAVEGRKKMKPINLTSARAWFDSMPRRAKSKKDKICLKLKPIGEGKGRKVS